MSLLLKIEAALNSKQTDKIKKWYNSQAKKRISKISDHVFGHSDTVEIPLKPENANDKIPLPIEDHLKEHGHKVVDYALGHSIDKYNRINSIGKVLHKTKAPDHIKRMFENDPNRNASKVSDHKIIITRNPLDVAGMSTNKGWTSCMNLNRDGRKGRDNMTPYSNKLEHDVKNGTHVAYLVHKNATNVESPIARIALKPVISHDNRHISLKPEPKAYGSSNSSFNNSVEDWAHQHFPLKDGKMYSLPKDMYSDSYSDNANIYNNNVNSEKAILKLPAKNRFSKNAKYHSKIATNTSNPEIIKHISENMPDQLPSLLHNSNVDINDLFDKHGYKTIDEMKTLPDVNRENSSNLLKHMAGNYKLNLKNQMAVAKYLKESKKDKTTNRKGVHIFFHTNNKLHPDVVNYLAKNSKEADDLAEHNGNKFNEASINKYIEHLTNKRRDKHAYVNRYALENVMDSPNFTSKHIDNLLSKSKDNHISHLLGYNLIDNKKTTDDQLRYIQNNAEHHFHKYNNNNLAEQAKLKLENRLKNRKD